MIQTEDSRLTTLHSSLFAPESDPSMSSHGDPASSFEIVIRPRSGWLSIDWKELVDFRELLWFLVWRDIAARYKQTILGGSWAVIQPLMMMIIFTLIFSRVANFPSQGFPYPVFVFAGLIPWTLFSQGFTQAALSMVSQQHLLTKVYFPRIFVPTAAAAVFVVDLIVSLGLYAVVLMFYRVMPSWTVIFVPLLVALAFIATMSVGLTLSALTVFYRDFRHVVPFLSQILLYLTFVIYPGSMIRQPLYRWILSLNPMFGIVMAFRSAILGLEWDFPCLAISTATALGFFVFGVFYFRRTERHFADFA
jgi:lipopolysaccharide transport system permease protein